MVRRCAAIHRVNMVCFHGEISILYSWKNACSGVIVENSHQEDMVKFSLQKMYLKNIPPDNVVRNKLLENQGLCMSGKFNFFLGQGIVKEFYVVSAKNEILQKCFTFQPEKLGYLVLDVSFLLNSSNFWLQYCQGNLNLHQGKCQGTLINHKCMNPENKINYPHKGAGMELYSLVWYTTTSL